MRTRRLANEPIRLAAGSFILNSGIEKLTDGDQRAAGIHATAKGSFPIFEKVPPEPFLKALGATEVAVGSALMLPLVPDRMAGVALAPLAGGLVWMYSQNDSLHKEHSLRPNGQGMALAKDVWLLGIALTLLATGRRRSKKPAKT